MKTIPLYKKNIQEKGTIFVCKSARIGSIGQICYNKQHWVNLHELKLFARFLYTEAKDIGIGRKKKEVEDYWSECESVNFRNLILILEHLDSRIR